MFRWELQFLKTKVLPLSGPQSNSNQHMIHKQGWDILARQYRCLSAEMAITLCTGFREKKIYWIYKAFDTWETKKDGFDCHLRRHL